MIPLVRSISPEVKSVFKVCLRLTVCVSSCDSIVRVTRVVVCSLLRVCRNTPRAIVCGSHIGANGLPLARLQFFTLYYLKKILFCPMALHSLLSFICEFERCRMGCQYVTQTTHLVCTISQLIDGSWEHCPTVPIYVDSKARAVR